MFYELTLGEVNLCHMNLHLMRHNFVIRTYIL